MKIAVLGTGVVGKTLATKLVERGHDVTMGARSAESEGLQEWLAATSAGKGGTFAEAAEGAEMVFLCVGGLVAHQVLEAAGNLSGKILVDVTNPLDFSEGFPPRLSVCNTDSLGEEIQSKQPDTKVVKALNTVSAHLMVDPVQIGDHTMLICGNDEEAKAAVSRLLSKDFGWTDVFDLGDISNARGLEAWLLLWTRLYGRLQSPDIGLKLVRPG